MGTTNSNSSVQLVSGTLVNNFARNLNGKDLHVCKRTPMPRFPLRQACAVLLRGTQQENMEGSIFTNIHTVYQLHFYSNEKLNSKISLVNYKQVYV